MPNENDQERLLAEYDQAMRQYRAANATMLRLAEDPDTSAEEFREASHLVTLLANRLKDLRSSLGVDFFDGKRNEA